MCVACRASKHAPSRGTGSTSLALNEGTPSRIWSDPAPGNAVQTNNLLRAGVGKLDASWPKILEKNTLALAKSVRRATRVAKLLAHRSTHISGPSAASKGLLVPLGSRPVSSEVHTRLVGTRQAVYVSSLAHDVAGDARGNAQSSSTLLLSARRRAA